MNPSVPNRLLRAAPPALRGVALAAALAAAALLGACEDGGTAGPAEPDPPDLSTPAGAIDALRVYYTYREADEAIALLAAGYHFIPLDPSVIPFIEPNVGAWSREDETAILEEILVATRSTWLDQVLLEINIHSIGDVVDGRVAVNATTELIFSVLSGTALERSRSEIEYLFEIQPNGDHLLTREKETSGNATGMRTVGVQKARALEEIEP